MSSRRDVSRSRLGFETGVRRLRKGRAQPHAALETPALGDRRGSRPGWSRASRRGAGGRFVVAEPRADAYADRLSRFGQGRQSDALLQLPGQDYRRQIGMRVPVAVRGVQRDRGTGVPRSLLVHRLVVKCVFQGVPECPRTRHRPDGDEQHGAHGSGPTLCRRHSCAPTLNEFTIRLVDPAPAIGRAYPEWPRNASGGFPVPRIGDQIQAAATLRLRSCSNGKADTVRVPAVTKLVTPTGPGHRQVTFCRR
jgi:hypothetical protein